ncbi:hypothetical protein EDWATA_02709 [Edwardsiella tarda ATCC 23685]|uniref:Uncharacterized protein n=1 Tax=Edwardsiella tarda ATCC 23685 TaxID=500638 RepID=D4F7H4_EDWTA|nr:hypothetical protein EDWATA_02709 [Edwardsiella tarda ATCC 23685]
MHKNGASLWCSRARPIGINGKNTFNRLITNKNKLLARFFHYCSGIDEAVS